MYNVYVLCIYVQSNEMEGKYMSFQRIHIQKYVDR